MKTHQEIIDFIDSKEVLTRIELITFIKEKYCDYTSSSICKKYWDYVLQTKDLSKLREYTIDKVINGNRRDDSDRIIEIIKSDKRFQGIGQKSAVRLMANLYGLKISQNVVKKYLEECNVRGKTYPDGTRRVF